MEKEIELVTKLADYESEINELENLIVQGKNIDKFPLYRKDLTTLRSNYTKIKNQLNNIN